MSETERTTVLTLADTVRDLRRRVEQLEQKAVFSRNNANGIRFNGDLQTNFIRLGQANSIPLRNQNTPQMRVCGADTNATFFEIFFDRFQNSVFFEVGCEREIEGGGAGNPVRAIHREMNPNTNRDLVRPVFMALMGGDNSPTTAFFGQRLYMSGSVLSDPTGTTFQTNGGLQTILWAGYDRGQSTWRYYVNANWQILSDERTKRDIQSFTKTADGLQPRRFRRVDCETEEVGFVAQEVERVLPEAVGEVDGTKTLKETVIIAALVNSVNELTKTVNELQQRIKQLEVERWKSSPNSSKP